MTAAATSEEAHAAALAGLSGMGPVRLAAALDGWSPTEAWSRAAAGTLGNTPRDVTALWRKEAAATDLARLAARLGVVGVRVTWQGHAAYPAELADDHQAPAVLFSKGDLGAIEGRRVAIVGARACTRYGRDVAYELGRDLAAHGVRVVSGLALGIDGAAHRGALAAKGAPPVAVVGSGLDVVYPRRNAELWAAVAEAGVVVSEAPLGAAPEPWRFPVRNRIIAALAEVVVVVESRHQGGSRHTIEAAETRDRPVMAVPGPVRSPQSELPNALLAEGCHPARDALDVLVALDLTPVPACARQTTVDIRPAPTGLGPAVLDAIGWQPVTFEQVVLAAGRSPGEVGVALAHLERDGWVSGSGGWWQRVG